MEKTLDESDVVSVKSEEDENYNSDIEKEGPNDNAEDIEPQIEGEDSDLDSIPDLDADAQELQDEEPGDEEVPNTLIAEQSYDVLENENENILQLDDDNDSMNEDYDEYLQKLDKGYKENILENFHKEEFHINHDEMLKLCQLKRNDKGFINDPLHKTTPILSKYEYTNILGIRAKQLSDGAPSVIKMTEDLIDNYIIADIELRQKALPFIVKRPLGNGGCEYWNVSDLEILL